jgi:phage terminase large subunit GpA-like protein
MTYSEKLKDPRWQKKRLEVLNRDNWACTQCDDTETELHIHHTYYKANNDPWEYPLKSLSTLCKHCHSVIEIHKKQYPNEVFVKCRRTHESSPGTHSYSILSFNKGKELYMLSFFNYEEHNRNLVLVIGVTENFLNNVRNRINEHKSNP